MSEIRTWDATIEVDRESIPASLSEYDLLEDQSKAAVREAALFVGEAREVHVQIWKTTKARGREKDRTFYVFRDARGEIRYAR